MSFPKGNRVRAGLHRFDFTEHDLRILLVLPAIRHLHVFTRFHRDRVPGTQLAEETGIPLKSLYQMLAKARRAIGLRRQAVERPLSDKPRWTYDERLQVRELLDYRNNFYLWNDGVEAAAQDYFLGFALKRFEIARLAFVEKLSRVEIARLMRITDGTAQAAIQVVYRRAGSTQQAKVAHGRRNGSTGSSADALRSPDFAPAGTARSCSDRATDRAGSNSG